MSNAADWLVKASRQLHPSPSVTSQSAARAPARTSANPTGFDGRLDAPMSRSRCLIGQISQHERLEIPMIYRSAFDFLVRHAFFHPTIRVDSDTRVTLDLNHRDGP